MVPSKGLQSLFHQVLVVAICILFVSNGKRVSSATIPPEGHEGKACMVASKVIKDRTLLDKKASDTQGQELQTYRDTEH